MLECKSSNLLSPCECIGQPCKIYRCFAWWYEINLWNRPEDTELVSSRIHLKETILSQTKITEEETVLWHACEWVQVYLKTWTFSALQFIRDRLWPHVPSEKENWKQPKRNPICECIGDSGRMVLKSLALMMVQNYCNCAGALVRQYSRTGGATASEARVHRAKKTISITVIIYVEEEACN